MLSCNKKRQLLRKETTARLSLYLNPMRFIKITVGTCCCIQQTMVGSATALFCRPEYSGWRNHLCNSNRVFTPCRLSALRIKIFRNPLPKYHRSPLGYPKVCKKSSSRTIMMKYLNTFNDFHGAHTCPIQKNPQTQAGIWVPPTWDREPTGMLATERPREGLAACPRWEVPVSRRSAEVRPGTGREAGLGHSTAFNGFDQGFTGGWVYLLRHAASTSLYAHPKHPCFVRSQEVHPTPGELCETGRVSFDQFSIEICPLTATTTHIYIAPHNQFWYKVLLS